MERVVGIFWGDFQKNCPKQLILIKTNKKFTYEVFCIFKFLQDLSKIERIKGCVEEQHILCFRVARFKKLAHFNQKK